MGSAMIATGAAASCTSKEAGTKVQRNQGLKECEPKKRVYEVRRTRYGGFDEEGELKGVEWVVDCELVRRHFWTDYFDQVSTANVGLGMATDGRWDACGKVTPRPLLPVQLELVWLNFLAVLTEYSNFPKLWLLHLAPSLSPQFHVLTILITR